MAQERPNRIAEWILLIRKQTPVLREHFLAWLEAVRENPRLIWETAAVRYSVYIVTGIVLLFGAKCAARMIAPPLPANIKELQTTADYHVLCSDPKCGHHFTIRREFEFKKFPVKCPKCGLLTGERARQCHSTKCTGRWVIAEEHDGEIRCPRCRAVFEK